MRSCPESDLDQRPTKSWLKRFLGFVVDPNQVNVALTRAQEGLCLVGEGCSGRAAGRGCSRAGCPLHAGPPDRPSCRRPPPAAMLPPVAPPPGLLRGPAEPGACGAGAGAEEAGRGSLKGPLSHALPSGCVRPGGPAQRIPMCLQQPLPAPTPTRLGFKGWLWPRSLTASWSLGLSPVGSVDLGGRRLDARPPG